MKTIVAMSRTCLLLTVLTALGVGGAILERIPGLVFLDRLVSTSRRDLCTGWPGIRVARPGPASSR
jgi:hypothetical protein